MCPFVVLSDKLRGTQSSSRPTGNPTVTVGVGICERLDVVDVGAILVTDLTLNVAGRPSAGGVEDVAGNWRNSHDETSDNGSTRIFIQG